MPREDIDPWKALEFIANSPLGIGDTLDFSEAVLAHEFAEVCKRFPAFAEFYA